ncbi:MAG: helix-turn-helix domain-containing protein [Bifidobacteriaceae bacterium]|jgi:excisionase family DNA binding protein|nr:helix-turn-helix domain-containing protein [Bifidobacteriaceae bacterium]
MTTTQFSASPAVQTILPPRNQTELTDIADFMTQHRGQAHLTGPDGRAIPIPDQVYNVLNQVVAALARGSAVSVAPVSMRLTTSQAADILGVSRPTLVRLLEDGEIPYEQPRRHRLLRLDDLLAFKDRRRASQRATLAEMTRQAVADGLYDRNAEDYAEALREAKHQV